ncbi:MAG: RibD family protein [Deltaproteobacteria bacterium]|nr:RibD family protein [Deltaproteobacteria bacterium]
MKRASRPWVVCHMVPSLDGRIVPTKWPVREGAYAEYERTAKALKGDAWIIGRISMEPYVKGQEASKTKVAAPTSRAPIPRTDHVADPKARRFAIAIDPSGKLAWRAGRIDDDHVITVITERVSDRYLATLRAVGVSYVFGGEDTIDVKRVLRTLRARFDIERLLLEGGGKINGSFLEADVVDELSLLVAPIVDGSTGTPALFDRAPAKARAFELVSVKKRAHDLVWLRYRRAR